MKKHDRPGSTEPEHDTPRDEHAYEDSWYRSLKALAESRGSQGTDEPDDHAEPEADPADEEPVDADSSSIPR
jgi:hypothetical protein